MIRGGWRLGLNNILQDATSSIMPVSTAVDCLDGQQLRFKSNWRTAVDLFSGRNRLPVSRGADVGFLDF